MARVRSPNFPAIGLSKSIERARKIFDREQQLPANRDVLSKHLGYSGYNGKSAKILSALSKFGLLEPVKDGKLRLSQRSMRILFPRNEVDKNEALREAASAPTLFREIAKEWDGGTPSDDNLANFLLHNGFSQTAIAPAIAAYRDTLSLVTPSAGQYNAATEDLEDEAGDEDDDMDMDPTRIPGKDAVGVGQTRKPVALQGEPFNLQLIKGGVLGAFDLRNKGDLETFVAGLQALKAFLPETQLEEDGLD